MKAAICYEYGKPLMVEEVEIDPPQQGEVKARTRACAICHSDIHLLGGEWSGRTPVIAGHEAAGVIEEVGPGVADVQPGDRVVISLIRSCGQCFYCTLGRPYNCEFDYPLRRQSRLHNQEGVSIKQGFSTAAFAEYVVVDQSQVVKVPEELPFDSASLLACGVITGMGAATNTAGVESGSTVVVIGAGGVGLNSVQGARLSGAAKIIAVDLLDNKLHASRIFGATHTINASLQDTREIVMDLTEGRGADYAFITVGSSLAIQQASQMIHKGGIAVIVGMPANDDVEFNLNAHHMTDGRTVMGSLMGSTRLSVDIPRLVELYRQDRLLLDELITSRYPLEQINEAIESVERGQELRSVIIF
jgi:Zn-dependent alcohol dehydrogenase